MQLIALIRMTCAQKLNLYDIQSRLQQIEDIIASFDHLDEDVADSITDELDSILRVLEDVPTYKGSARPDLYVVT